MKDHHHDDPGGSPEQRRRKERGRTDRARGAPLEQERPIRITAEQVQRSLRDSQRVRSRRQVPKKQLGQQVRAPHGRREGDSAALFRDRFWLSAVLTLPALVWGQVLPGVLEFSPPTVAGARWIAAASGTAVFAYGGWPFINGAFGELKNRLPGMMTLSSLALTIAFTLSVAVEFGFSGPSLWEGVATLVTVMLLGRWIVMRSITQAEGALNGLAELLPDQASRVSNGSAEVVPVGDLRIGDVLLVRPGAPVPADGGIIQGASHVDESMLTGESRPVGKEIGDPVMAGTVNQSGAFRFTVTATGERTTLAAIMRLVNAAQPTRLRAKAAADRAAFSLTIVAIAAGVLTLMSWLVVRPWDVSFAVQRMVTVLVISCPQALALAVPLVIGISTGVAARKGLLIRDHRGLENARNLTTIVFDTGTLTSGEHRVIDVATIDGLAADDALRLAAAVERDSDHPFARAIRQSAMERGLEIPSATDFRPVAGQGVMAVFDGRRFAVGGPNLLQELNADPEHALAAEAISASARGQNTIYLVEDTRVIAAFAVADALRPESVAAVKRLRRLGIEVAMMTGDSSSVARAVAKQLGIQRVLAQVRPEDKARRIEELRKLGKRIGMVGDGVTAAPALAAADVGVAIGAGTEVAVEAGDVVLVRNDPRDVPLMVKLARASHRKMTQNLWMAAGYNIVAIPLAAGVLSAQGIILSPALGALLMSASTIILAVNAQLLRRVKL